MNTKPKKAIAYLRVSTEKQEEHGYGYELQMERIQAFARHEGFEIVHVSKDAHTGMGNDSIRGRPGVLEAIKLSQHEGWPILVDGLDRFARNVQTVEKIVADGKLKVISCRSGVGVSRGVAVGEAARAQREGELISQRTKQRLQELKNEGVQLGNRTNLADARSKAVAVNKGRAQERVRELSPIIRELRAQGRETAKQIAEGLNLMNERTRRGGEWTADNIRRLLEQVADVHREENQAVDLENENWGRF